ncbi:MAG: tetratricopeptide repeat protein, partial [Deltaproteobacteria bacterium]|nr:tetratricopeptide repeat protein [Candidatus Tharpella aukensis]
FHITNIIIHILATLSLFFLLKSLFDFISGDYRSFSGDGRFTTSIVILSTVGLWALNPVQTNAVTYLVQRMTSMAALFYFLALGCYLRGRSAHLRKVDHRKILLWYFLTSLFAICGLMCKENTVTLPVVIALVEFLFVCDGSVSIFLKKYRVVLILAILVLLPIIYFKLPGFLEGYGRRHFTLSERLLTELRVVLSYIFILLLPLPRFLNLEHDPVLSTSLFAPASTFVSLVFLSIVVICAWRVRKRYPLVTFAVFWFFINLLIESSFIPLELKFEHRLYLPSAGLYLAVSLLIAGLIFRLYSGRAEDRRNFGIIVVAFLVVVLSGLSLLTFKRNLVWRDAVTLYRDCAFKSPNKARSHSNLARALIEQKAYKETIAECEKALVLGVEGYECYWVTAANLIVAISKTEGDRRAIEKAETLLENSPEKAKINSYKSFLHNLGKTYIDESMYQKAYDIFLRGFKLASKNRYADPRWKADMNLFAGDLFSLLNTCAERNIDLDTDGLIADGSSLSAYEKMAKFSLEMGVPELAVLYCKRSVVKEGEMPPGCVDVSKVLKDRNSLSSVQKLKGTIKTTYFYHPFASKFNFYMAVVYGLEKVGLPDFFLVDYVLQLAAELQPVNPDVTLLRSWLYYQRSQFDEAICEVDKAIDMDSEYAQLWINRGLYCAGAGRGEDALSDFAKAKELYPDNPKNIKFNRMMVINKFNVGKRVNK